MMHWVKWKCGKFKIIIRYNRKEELYKSFNAKLKRAKSVANTLQFVYGEKIKGEE